MEQLGKFTPFLQSWEIDRVGVHRIVMALQYNGATGIPIDQVPTPPREVQHVRTMVQPEDGDSHGLVQFFFEGANEADVGRALEVYEFNGSYQQEPILSHPKILQLMRQYKGRLKDGRVEWAASLSGSSRNGVGGGAKSSDINPMYGVDSYLDFGATWSATRIYATMPGDLWAGVGEIHNNVPGGPPTPGNRNWLKLAPVGRQRGNVTEVTAVYLLSGRNGWVAPVYDGSIV